MIPAYTRPLSPLNLDQVIDHAPLQRLRGNDGSDVLEPQVLTGHVCAPSTDRTLLETYGICMVFAHHERQAARWSRCLFSEAVADLLLELSLEGQFPFEFEALPSVGLLTTLEATTTHRPAPALPLRAWVTPASLDALERGVQGGWVQCSRLRWSSPSAAR